MLRIVVDTLYENEQDEAIETVCNVIESHLTQLQREEIFKVYSDVMSKLEKAESEPPDEQEVAAKNPYFCEDCEE